MIRAPHQDTAGRHEPVALQIADAHWSPEEGLVVPEGGAAVAVDAWGQAVEQGAAAELEARHPTLPREEGPGVLLPGLVDCHAHLECAALAGKVPPAGGLAGWVGALVRTRAPMSHEELEQAALRAAHEMRALGTVAVADVCTLLSTAPILRKAALLGLSLLEVVGADDASATQALEDAQARLQAAPGDESVQVRAIPHSTHGTTPAAIEALRGESGVRSIHVAEHDDEDAWLERGEGPFAPFLLSRGATFPGMRAIEHLERLGAIGAETLLVHLVTASPDELARAASLGATAVLCPRSNLHIGGRLPDLRAVRQAGLPWVLGTDSLASTPDHDLLGEVAVLAEDFADVPADEILTAATVGGARALGLRHHPHVRIPWSRLGFLVPREPVAEVAR